MCPEWENECMCETECESGWKHSYGVCGGCIIKHNEAIQKTRLVVIAEVNAASIGSTRAAEPGGKNRGKGKTRALSACRWDAIWLSEGTERGGARPSAQVYEGDSKTSTKPLLLVKSKRSFLLQVSLFPGHLALSLPLSSELSWEVAKHRPLLLGSGEPQPSCCEGSWSLASDCSSGGPGSGCTLMLAWSSSRLGCPRHLQTSSFSEQKS